MAVGHRQFRELLSGGDRRSIADSQRVRTLIERRPARLQALAALIGDPDALVVQRALDLLEKFAHEHPQWVEPYKNVFLGPLAESDRWEIRLQIVRALPLFRWTRTQLRRVEEILISNIAFPQTFVRAWALDSLATLSLRSVRLAPLVMQRLAEFEQSSSKALQARARAIRERLVGPSRTKSSTPVRSSARRPERESRRQTRSPRPRARS
jgi:hypothetical protein